MADLIVRLEKQTPTSSGPSLIRSILGTSLEAIEPLFPDDSVAELSSLFNVTLKAGSSPAVAIGKLTEHKQIEYAHAPQERGS